MTSLTPEIVEIAFDEPDEDGNVFERGVILRAGTEVQGNCRVGAYSRINGATLYPNTVVGRYCSIARNAAIGAPDHPYECLGTSLALAGTHSSLTFAITQLGSDVLVCANATVLAGIRIGDGAVIGAGAVVTKDIEPFAIVVGNPARRLRYRFPKDIRDRLCELRWWDRDESVVNALPHADPLECIRMLSVACD